MSLSSELVRVTVTRSTGLFIDGILCNDLICETIFSCCSPANFLRFSRTCRVAHSAVRTYTARAFNINRHLCRFFTNVSAFRSVQARTGTLVSGSNALQFFDRSHYPESDLDLYVHSHWGLEVGNHLLQAGYCFVPTRIQNRSFEATVSDSNIFVNHWLYPIRGVAAIYTFTKRTLSEPIVELKIQLMIADAPMEVILSFHSTCVMNVISFDKAFCLYPRATLEERRALVCGREGLRQESAIAKYAARGWQMVDELPLEDRGNDNRSFRFGPRWIKDGDSWVIPLNLDDVVGPPPFTTRSTPLSEDPVISTTWKLVYDLSQRAMMVYSVLSSPILRYSYLIMDEELDDVLTQVLERRRESEFDRQDRPLFNIRRYFDESLLIISQAHLQEQKLIGLRP